MMPAALGADLEKKNKLQLEVELDTVCSLSSAESNVAVSIERQLSKSYGSEVVVHISPLFHEKLSQQSIDRADKDLGFWREARIDGTEVRVEEVVDACMAAFTANHASLYFYGVAKPIIQLIPGRAQLYCMPESFQEPWFVQCHCKEKDQQKWFFMTAEEAFAH